MKYHKNNYKHSFIISVTGKINQESFDQNGPPYIVTPSD